MRGTMTDLFDFWRTPWSQPLREACAWVGDAPPIGGCPLKNAVAPRWVRPFFLQHWVVQTIVARLAWLKAHPQVTRDSFGRESKTDWERVMWTYTEPGCWRGMREEKLLWTILCEVERLLRIVLESPRMVGPVEWTLETLEACGHIAQGYAELKRRHKAVGAREILWAELQRFVTSQGEEKEVSRLAGD